MKAEARRKLEEDVRRRFDLLKDSMDESVMRHWAATEAEAIGYGGIMIVHRATGTARSTITGTQDPPAQAPPTGHRRGQGSPQATSAASLPSTEPRTVRPRPSWVGPA